MRRDRLSALAIVLGFLAFFLMSIVFVFLGRLNADEGWYLYASQLVYEKRVPYHDFAYTQTPLLPYVYGLQQKYLQSGLYPGRILSVIFSCLSLALATFLAERCGGRKAAVTNVVLWLSFTYGIYFNSIVKTYSLLTLLLLVSLLSLVCLTETRTRLVISTGSVFLAVLTRLSALFFAVPVIAHIISPVREHKRTKVVVLVSLAALSVMLYGVLVWPDPGAVKWNLLSHHVSKWGEASLGGKAYDIVFRRIPSFVFSYFPYVLIMVSLLTVSRRYLREKKKILVALLAVAAFAIPHLATGEWHAEYLVPTVFASFPIMSIMIALLYERKDDGARITIEVALFFAVLLGATEGGMRYIDLSGGELPVREAKAVAEVVKENCLADEEVLVLEALWVAVEAERRPLPGMTMAHFSYSSADEETARRLKLVNGEMIAEYLRAGRPAVVIMTDHDRDILRKDKYSPDIEYYLEERYCRKMRKSDFGQRRGEVEVYIRRGSGKGPEGRECA